MSDIEKTITEDDKLYDSIVYKNNNYFKIKFKDYLTLINSDSIKIGSFRNELIMCLIIVLNNIVVDTIEYIKKEKNGLYDVKEEYIKYVLNNYGFIDKYLKKYDKTIKYDDNLFFDSKKTFKYLEDINGKKLNIDSSSKNFLNFIIMSLQNDITELTCTMLNVCDKKMLNTKYLLQATKYIIKHELVLKQIVLKLDSNKQLSDDLNNNEE